MASRGRRGGIGHRIYYFLLGLAAALLICTVALNVRVYRQLQQSIRMVFHSEGVISRVDILLIARGDAVYALQSYLLTGDREFRATYLNRRERLQAEAAQLAVQVREDPVQHAYAVRLRNHLDERIALYQRALAAYEGGEHDTRELLTNSVSLRQYRALRVSADRVLARERSVLERQRNEMSALLARTLFIVLIGNVVALLAAVIGLFMIRRLARARDRARQAEWEAEAAHQVSRKKTVFLANMSHEFRTPMNAILGFSDLLSRALKDERERQYALAIATSSKALLALLNDVLDLSKLESGKAELHLVATDLRELIESSLAVFAQMARDKGLSLRTVLEPTISNWLMVDPMRLRQVLFNLIGNAVKYTDHGGVIVRAGCEDVESGARCSLRIAVNDTGIGIAKEQMTHIFEPFVQVEDDAPARREGTGLGLSISQGLMTLMGGEIDARSTLGHGSSFRIRLPGLEIARAPAESDAPDAWLTDFSRLRPARILIVDDALWNREVIQALLADSGHELIYAVDGEQAVALARAQRPDVILMDIRMPRMDGRRARALIREDPALRDSAIIAVTASAPDNERNEDLRKQFDGYLRKPFDRQDLFAVLSRVLPRREIGPEQAAPAEEQETFAPPMPAERLRLETRLREIETTVLPRLRETSAMRESLGLAHELIGIGRGLGRPELIDYARRLRTAAEGFNLARVETLLHQAAAQLRAKDAHVD